MRVRSFPVLLLTGDNVVGIDGAIAVRPPVAINHGPEGRRRVGIGASAIKKSVRDIAHGFSNRCRRDECSEACLRVERGCSANVQA